MKPIDIYKQTVTTPNHLNVQHQDTKKDIEEALEVISFRLQSAKDFFYQRDFETLLEKVQIELNYHWNEMSEQNKEGEKNVSL